jgi:hypothetical protein
MRLARRDQPEAATGPTPVGKSLANTTPWDHLAPFSPVSQVQNFQADLAEGADDYGGGVYTGDDASADDPTGVLHTCKAAGCLRISGSARRRSVPSATQAYRFGGVAGSKLAETQILDDPGGALRVPPIQIPFSCWG